MKKLLILLSFSFFFLPALPAQSQSSYYGGGGGYYFGLASYQYFWNNASKSEKAAFSIDQGFSAIFSGIRLIEHGQRMENQINVRRNNLENYKSVKRYYTEGIPPFANRGPDGRPRSPKITWQDVESIR